MDGLRQQLRGEVRRLAKMTGMAFVGVLLIAVASLFSAQPAVTFFRILSLAGTALVVLSVAMMIVTFRKARALVPGALLVSLSTALVVCGVQLVVAADRPAPVTGFLALAAGTLLGAGWARTSTVFVDGDMVRSRGTAWYLAVWAGTFLLNQLMALSAGGSPATGLSVLLVGTGIATGNTGVQLLRFRQAIAMAAPTHAVV